MAKANNKRNHYDKKKTVQGSGKFTKRPSSGGERFSQGFREGTPPSKARQRKKPYRGQGK
tara:strand:+ start:184 stop:363 length:180 start_codon:yes stop_codon:yes gene_type:complete